MTNNGRILAAQRDARCLEEFVRSMEPWALLTVSNLFLEDREDFRQEVRIGIWKAVRNYRPEMNTSEKSFVALCVRRHMATAVKTSLRAKHLVLTTAVRQMNEPDTNEPHDAVSLLPALSTFDALLDNRHDLRAIAELIRSRLSPLEANVILARANGLSYEETAQLLGCNTKSIDNGLQRAYEKLAGDVPVRKYTCPTCGGATVKTKTGPGRPPRCNVCRFKDLAQAA